MFGLFRRKRRSVQTATTRFRIVRTDSTEGQSYFTIEEWTSHYACADNLWLPVDRHNFQCFHRTLAEAKIEFAKLFIPAPTITRTIVAEA